MRFFFKPILILAGLLVPLLVGAQNPVKTLPRNYWLEFENSQVRVVHVHYDAKERLPRHDHPKTPTLYVYLADAGPVRFKHTGANPYALDRPPVKQGGFRLNPGVLEEHEVENISDTPTDFLRVEFKTIPFKRATLRGHFPPAQAEFWNMAQPRQITFEDQNLRITRFGYAPGAKHVLPAATGRKAIDIAVRAGEAQLGTQRKALHAGEPWAAPATSTSVRNVGASEIEILRVELKASTRKPT
jgi:quercetin dioxygenase-like cupin family protein